MKPYICCCMAMLLLVFTSTSVAAPSAPDAFAASFVETRTLPDFDQPLVSHGVLRFRADKGFRWEINRPYHYVFQMRDGKAHEVLPDGTRRTLKPDQTPWLKAVERMFVGALSGDQARLEQYFKVETKPHKGGRTVTLVPRQGAMAKVVERIEVTERSPGHPEHLVIDEASGAHLDIRFTPLAGDGGPGS